MFNKVGEFRNNLASMATLRVWQRFPTVPKTPDRKSTYRIWCKMLKKRNKECLCGTDATGQESLGVSTPYENCLYTLSFGQLVLFI